MNEHLLKEVSNWYEEWNGRGLNPRPYDPEDCDRRRRGNDFKERQKRRDELLKEYEQVRNKYKRRNNS